MNSVIFSALAQPNRLRSIELLRDGPRPVGEMLCGFGCACRIYMNTGAFFALPAVFMCGRSLSRKFTNFRPSRFKN